MAHDPNAPGSPGYFRIECVVFDTSILLLMFLKGIPALEQVLATLNAPYVPVVPTPVIGELERLWRVGRPRLRRAARSALDLVLRSFSIAEAGDGADDAVAQLALSHGCAVATCDMDLRRRLMRLGVRVIYFRESSGRLEADDYSP